MAKYIRSNYARLPIFYCDDGRRVKTVYVSSIREGTTIERLERKYSIYGPVQSCALEFHADSDETYAIVTMHYAFDAAKILRDYPEEVKHLYNLLPRRLATNSRNRAQNLSKKEITEKIDRLEVTVVPAKNCSELLPSSTVPKSVPSELSKSQKEKPEELKQDPLIENKPPVEEIVVPVRRRRRVVSSKMKERVTNKKPAVEKPLASTLQPSQTPVPNSNSSLMSENIQIKSLTSPSVVTTHHKISIPSPVPEDIQINPFTSLNDDCLISIFSFCDKLDVVNLSLVCERFRFIVYNYLKAKMSKVVDLSKIKPCDKITLSEATEFLKFINAAQNMQHLELSLSSFDKYEDQLILEEIFKCCGPNLRGIKFTGFSFKEGSVTEWKHLFQGFECVTFQQCIFSTSHFNSLLKICDNLEVLNMTSSNSCGADFDNDDIKQDFSEFKCNKLKEFRLISSRHCGKSSELIWLVKNNPNLSVLRMLDVGDSIKLSGEIVQRIGQLQQMQDLAFSLQNFTFDVMDNLHHLTRLKELNSLNLQCDWMNISSFVKALALAASRQIENLSFECVDIDVSFMKAIAKFRKLKYLKLENTVVNEPSQEVFEQSLMDLTFRLNNLTHFHCQMHFFTEDSLVQFVERMRKLAHLQISGLVMNLILCMRFVSVCGRRVNGLKLNIVIDNYQYLNEYLDLLRSEYGKVIEIQSLYD